MLAGEAKWARSVDGRRLAADLREKTRALRVRRPAAQLPDHDDAGPDAGPGVTDHPEAVRLALCAREEIRNPPAGVLTVTAADIFAPA